MYQVAEVVRNLAARNRDAALSAAERTMYERARVDLVSEISPALKVSAEAAEAYLDDALAKGVLKPARNRRRRSNSPGRGLGTPTGIAGSSARGTRHRRAGRQCALDAAAGAARRQRTAGIENALPSDVPPASPTHM